MQKWQDEGASVTPTRRHLPNRVHADGRFIASPARGTMMGNRGGQFHDAVTQTITKRVPWANKQWICCVLQFKGRHRTVWTQGYTELFFLDEVTAFSAGHRPCFECRRADAIAFQRALFDAFGNQEKWEKPPKVAIMDALLHEARLKADAHATSFDQLPVGSVFKMGEDIFAKTTDGAKLWTIHGYGESLNISGNQIVDVLTPAPFLAVLSGGYKPQWHPTSGVVAFG